MLKRARPLRDLLPGVGLCLLITGIAVAVQFAEERAVEHPYVEALVIAILLGVVIRTAWKPGSRWTSGIAFSAKQLLEFAVVLLGASLSVAAIMAVGPALLLTVIATVFVMIAISFGLCRVLGLPARVATLIACGNAICGNSAIAAIAPVIGADGDDVAVSISFTAILGVLMVLGLPLLIPLLALSPHQYGVLAGMTVYAVPQVLAATIPAGLVSTQIGTLVKLIRVLTIGPVVVGLAFIAHRLNAGTGTRPKLSGLIPWFITGFIVLAVLRSLGLIPDAAVAPISTVSKLLTIMSMAGLGLGVDVRVMSEVGSRVTAAVTLSLLVLLTISVLVIRLPGLT